MANLDSPFGASYPPIGEPAGVEPPAAMDYPDMFAAIVRNPAWVANLFFMLVAGFIPLIGSILVAGYQFEVVEALVRQPRQMYPDFDWGRVKQYLMRGIWPVVVKLMLGFVLAPFAFVIWFGSIIVLSSASAAGNPQIPTAVGIVMLISAGILLALLAIAVNCVGLAFQLRAGLIQDFAPTFDFPWIQDFLGKMWFEILVGQLFILVAGFALCALGLLVFCIGMYLAIVATFLANAIFCAQLYRLYLARGGIPIPLQPLPVASYSG